ncbi:MAG: beta-propeller domain-containing protein, partial [Thermoplasmata archaeon]|nr:beta-propeller domain-containing protein [Thermoplasmata archaeon]
GNPVEMYVVDDKAYVIVSSDYGYWYSFSRWGWWDMGMITYRYQIGSRLAIIDISDLTSPQVMREIGIEGFVTDSRRVGEVIYLVSNCYSWYNTYSDTQMEDRTYVMSLNIADTENIKQMDETSFPGRSNVIHVTTDHLFVAKWDRDNGDWWGSSDITLVDISDPQGSIVVKATFYVSGQVNDKYQMDEYDGVLRVVSHFWGRGQKSELWTFDVTDPWFVKQLGHLVIDDEGNLMATRFEGTRGYTIHLPRSIDPLDVLDISDPTNPVLCDVFEMPGWVTHMEVRGMKIIAIGMDDSGGERNVAVSLFDVSDPWNAVMEDRVRIGLSYASSEAITEPKALTVLDEQGLILIPFSTYEYDSSTGYQYYSGVQIVSFDLEGGDLSMRGYYEQPTQVLRTRAIGNHVMSTSNDHLVVADITDPDEPLVITELELSPNVIDYHKVIGRYAEVTMVAQSSYYRYYPSDLLLRVFSDTVSEIETPLWEVEIGQCPDAWLWDGRYIHVFNEEKMQILHGWSIEAGCYRILKMTTYDLLGDGEGPISKRTLKIREWNETPFIPIGWYESISSSSYYYDFYQYNPSYNLMSDASNPVLLDGGYIAIYVQDELLIVGVGEYRSTLPVWSTDIECEGFLGLLAAGSGLYILSYEYVKTYYAGNAYRWTYQYEVSFFRYECFEGPDVGEPVQIPGLPLGCSDDGHWLYTVASWYEGTDT